MQGQLSEQASLLSAKSHGDSLIFQLCPCNCKWQEVKDGFVCYNSRKGGKRSVWGCYNFGIALKASCCFAFFSIFFPLRFDLIWGERSKADSIVIVLRGTCLCLLPLISFLCNSLVSLPLTFMCSCRQACEPVLLWTCHLFVTLSCPPPVKARVNMGHSGWPTEGWLEQCGGVCLESFDCKNQASPTCGMDDSWLEASESPTVPSM